MNFQQKKRLQFIIGIFLLCFGITVIGMSAFFHEISFFVTPSILKKTNKNGFLRLGGMVKKGTFQTKNEGYTFTVEDEKEGVSVFYKGLLPPLFKEGQGIVVEGKLDKSKDLFIATNIFAKHDETYMPKTLVQDLKESSQWQKSY